MKAVAVLIVEDNLGDVVLMREALKESPVATKVYVVPDVPRALAFLQNHERYYNPIQPGCDGCGSASAWENRV